MALVKFGGGVTEMRGSIGGTTFSRGPAGAIARKNTKPINPRSTAQNARRAAQAVLAKYWSNDLTEQQRVDWRAYAAATSWTNRLGESIQISGNAAFIRLNAFQLMIPSVIIAAAPTAVGHAGGVTWTFLAESDNTQLVVAEPGGAFDKDTDIHTLWMSTAFPQEPGHIAKPKGFIYHERIWGSSGVPLVFPLTIDAPYTMREGQLVTSRVMFQDEHYRISGPFFASVVAAPGI